MTTRRAAWLLGALLYAAFWLWYTPLGGPLTATEIEGFVAELERRGGDPQRIARVRRFMEEDRGRPFLMVNVLDLADDPPSLPATGPGAPASALLDHYMAHMVRELFARACHPVMVGDAVADALDLVGIEGAESWTAAGVVRYRSRRDMMAIATHPAFAERHAYKLAALEKTIAYPVEPRFHLGDPRLLLALALLAALGLVDRWLPAGRR